MAKKDLTQAVTVKRSEAEPEAVELIASAILDVADAFDRINKSRLSRRVIVLLLRDLTSIGIREIEDILIAAPKLRSYIKETK